MGFVVVVVMVLVWVLQLDQAVGGGCRGRACCGRAGGGSACRRDLRPLAVW